jgi:hypothetical protein
MVPRGEVGLIFARMGLATAVLTPELFGALMVMVIGTTFVTPPWLAWLAGVRRTEYRSISRTGEHRRIEDLTAGERDDRDDRDDPRQDIGTVDDLVSGERLD